MIPKLFHAYVVRYEVQKQLDTDPLCMSQGTLPVRATCHSDQLYTYVSLHLHSGQDTNASMRKLWPGERQKRG